MNIRRLLVWYLMLNKRLIRKWSFIVIMLAAPLFVVCITYIAGSDKGIVRVLMYNEDASSAMSSDIIDKLCSLDSVIQYEEVFSREDGIDRVKSGKADALWIFKSGAEEVMKQSVRDGRVKAQIGVVERDETIALNVARERLYSLLFPYYNYEIYRYFVKDMLESGDTVTEEELNRQFYSDTISGSLFTRIYSNGEEMTGNTDYLLTPLRGMLAVWFVLCGLVSCMYYLNDKKNGVFDRADTSHTLLMETGYHIVMLIIAVVIMSVGILILGVGTTFVNELMCMAALLWTVTGYCCLIRRLCVKQEILGVLIPVLIILMLGLSPIFISNRIFAAFRFLHPVYLYIMSVNSVSSLVELLIYGAVLYTVCLFFDIIRKR